MKLVAVVLFLFTSVMAKSQELTVFTASESVELSDQYGKTYAINFEKKTTYLLLFKGNRTIGTEGVKWTRAIRKILKPETPFYPVMEMKRFYRLLPLPIKKHIVINHLQKELHNPNIILIHKYFMYY